MKVVSVKEVDKNIFELTYQPNILEMLIGKKIHTRKFKVIDTYEYKNFEGRHPVVDMQIFETLSFMDVATKRINSYLLYKEHSGS